MGLYRSHPASRQCRNAGRLSESDSEHGSVCTWQDEWGLERERIVLFFNSGIMIEWSGKMLFRNFRVSRETV